MSEIRVDSVLNVAGDDNPTLVVGTAQVTTSGTAFDFTGIPAWVKRVSVMFADVGLTGSDHILVQLGDSGGFETSGYVATGSDGSGNDYNSTSGYPIYMGSTSHDISGSMVIELQDTNTWVQRHNGRLSATQQTDGGGYKALSDTLTQVRVTRSGASTFNLGSVNINYE